MSPLSPSPLLALAPGYAALAAGGRVHEAHLADSADPLAGLADLLAPLRRRGRVRVVLSHELARVWLLPAPPMRLATAELQGWLAETLAGRFGEPARAWRLAWQPAPPGRPLLVTALDAAWLEALQAALASQGLRAAMVAPWLAGAANRLRRPLARGAAWLALAEPGRITLARLEAGEFAALRSSRVAGEPAAALADMVAREGLRAGLAGAAPVWLAADRVEADWRQSGLDIRPAAAAGLLGT